MEMFPKIKFTFCCFLHIVGKDVVLSAVSLSLLQNRENSPRTLSRVMEVGARETQFYELFTKCVLF